MLNPITTIQKIYQLENNPTHNGLARTTIEQHEAELGIQLPAPLYHYLLEMGNAKIVNESHHQFIQLPFERLGEYIVIGKTCDDDGVWGIHQDDLKHTNPMVQMSRNFDAIDPNQVHWFDELPLAEFLVAIAIINGTNAGLAHHAQIYDLENKCIPTDLIEQLTQFSHEILEIRQPHERYFQADDFSVVMMVGIGENIPNAFLIGTQYRKKFDDFIITLAIGDTDNFTY